MGPFVPAPEVEASVPVSKLEGRAGLSARSMFIAQETWEGIQEDGIQLLRYGTFL